MAEQMTAAVLHKINDVRIEQVEVPRIEDDLDVLVRIKAVGVCGSDIHFYREGRIGQFVVEKPIILGHESSGEVVEVGKAVKHLRPGDKVVIEPGYPDRTCQFCKTGKYNLCATVPFMATPPTDGAFCEYVVWPGDFVYKVPDNVSFEEASLVEPLAVALQATKRARIHPGMTVAIVGAGPIGLTTLLAATAHGATTTFISDVYPMRLDLATKLGATYTINAKDTDQVEAVLAATGGEGCDVVLETAGTPDTVRQSMAMVKRGGVVTLVGMCAELDFAVPVMDIIMREYDVRGVFRYANCHPVAIALLSSGRVNVKPLITHEFPLAQAKEALDFSDTRKDVAVKVLVKP